MVVLLDERREDGSSLYMRAELTDDGGLDIMGHDLGPVTDSISTTSEYEWHYVVAAADLPAALALLGGQPDADVLGLLLQRWSGPASYQLGPTLRNSGLKYEFWSWP